MQPPAKVVPVVADMVTVSEHAQGKVTSSAKFFRDEHARTRIEHGDMATISDPVKGESYILKMPEKIAIPAQPKPEMPAMPPLSVPSVPKPAMPQAKPPEPPQIADLGEKTIDGIKVQGKRFTLPAPPAIPEPPKLATEIPQMPKPPGAPKLPAAPALTAPKPPTAEVWTSPELNLPIQASTFDPQTGARAVTEMKNIQAGAKLDPAMFQVPPDFKIAPPPKPPSHIA